MLVILPVYVIEGTGCCESLGKKLQHKCLLFGQLSALLTTFRLLTPALIVCPETCVDGLPRACRGWVLLSLHLLLILW